MIDKDYTWDPLLPGSNDQKKLYIRSNLSLAAMLEQLAEEASELSQAALKKARKLREENPTPKTMSEIDDDLSEEIADVNLCVDILKHSVPQKIYEFKLDRWYRRIIQKREEDNARN